MSDTRPADPLEAHFETPGSLRRPGPVGRAVRLGFGAAILWMVLPAVPNFPNALRVGAPSGHDWLVSVLLIAWLIPYVVNIGWRVNWKRLPRYAALGLLVAAAGIGYPIWGHWWNPAFGVTWWTLNLYTFGHLGLSFVLAAVLATPGCEMRSVPDLLARLRGRRAREHYCPGWMDPLDRWEAARAG